MSSADFFPFADLARYWWLPLTALVLDRLVGDPPAFPHPVRMVGSLLAAIEPRARRAMRSARAAGVVAACLALFCTWAVLRLLLLGPQFVSCLLAVYLAFAGLAMGQLLREGRAALALLERGETAQARHAVGMLVSRDVSGAEPAELCRVLAESLAENLNDAFVAPFFWLVLGGPVGLWLYKTASTMDSMWGYPHEPWTRFGTAAARLDDFLAFIPARLTAFFLVLTACCRLSFTQGPAAAPSCLALLRRIAADARTMKSPNAGWPMAACAWIHQAAMGGEAIYAGKKVEKPLLGPAGTRWTTESLRSLCTTLTLGGYTAAACLWVAVLLVW